MCNVIYSYQENFEETQENVLLGFFYTTQNAFLEDIRLRIILDRGWWGTLMEQFHLEMFVFIFGNERFVVVGLCIMNWILLHLTNPVKPKKKH